jgi:hypothetical protein
MGILGALKSSFTEVVGNIAAGYKNAYAVTTTVLNPFSKNKVVATTNSKIANAVIESAANSPYSTAALAVGGELGLLGKAKNVVSGLSKTVKVGLAVAGLSTVGVVAANPKLAAPVVSAVGQFTPEQIIKTSSAIGRVTNTSDKSVSTLEKIKDAAVTNPVLTTAILAGLGYIGYKAINPFIQTKIAIDSNTQTKINNDLLAENNNLMKEPSSPSSSSPDQTGANKNDEKIADLQSDASVKIAEINAKAALAIEEERTKQAGILSAVPAVPVAATIPSNVKAVAPRTKKKAKKKTKKKAKPKKKAKTLKRKKKKR